MITFVRFSSGVRGDAYELAAAIDIALGYPRTHDPGEEIIDWAPGTPLPYTESACEIMENAAQRRIVGVDDAILSDLDGQTIEITDGQGQPKNVTVTTVGTGRDLVSVFDRVSDYSTRRPPRGGLPAPASLAAKAKGRGR